MLEAELASEQKFVGRWFDAGDEMELLVAVKEI